MGASKAFAILFALCAALAFADELEVKSPPEQFYRGLNNPHYPTQNSIASSDDRNINEPHSLIDKPHFSSSSEESRESNEKWEHKKHPGLHNPHITTSEENPHTSPAKPHFPSSSEESLESREKWDHIKHPGWHNFNHGPHKPHFPANSEQSLDSDEKLEPIRPPGWHHPHFLQNTEHSSVNTRVSERRRPMFYPYLPYYFYHPHANPSNNDDEFESIEARAKSDSIEESNTQVRFKGPFYHGLNNPNFPVNNDGTQENNVYPIRPFHHHKHHHNHHGHGKPSESQEVPYDGINKEGSGEEEITPLADRAKILLQEEDDNVDDQNDEDDLVNDEARAASFRSFLELRKASISIECDALNTPRYSCYNCWNYLQCKPEGGKIKACKDPYQPYCNNGICSATPSAECSNL